jgi:hypothetical protein
MSLTKKIARLRPIQTLRQKWRRGVAATEFALTLPIWATLLLGCIDGGYCMLMNQRVDRIAYTVDDIVTQYEKIKTSDLDDIMLAAGELMQPFDFGPKGVVIVTSVFKPAGDAAIIKWQHTGGGSLSRGSKIGTTGQIPALPNGLILNDNDNVIISEVYYDFKPMFFDSQYTAGDIYRVAIYKPRLSPLITPPT